MEIDVAGILCYAKNKIDAFPQTVRKGFTVWGNEKERVISMKKTKRILSSLMALTLSVGAVGSIPAVAQTNVTDYPQVWEGTGKEAGEKALEAYFGFPHRQLDNMEDYTFSEPYRFYDFRTMTALPDSVYYLVAKDDVWIGKIQLSVTPEADGTYTPTCAYRSGVSEKLVDAISEDKDFLLGCSAGYFMNGQIRSEAIYVDGETYDLAREELIGGDPDTMEYIKYGWKDPNADATYITPSQTKTMPESKDTTQNALDLLEEALQKDPNPDLARERLCEDLGVSALTDLTYSTPYHYYDFYTQELAVPESGDAYTYWILLYRDGVYCGNLSVTPALGLIQKDLKPYACVETALEQQDDMWFGGAIVDGLPAELVYTGGVIYSLNFGETKTDLVWGQLPHSDYNSGMIIETTTTPAVTITQEPNLSILGDVNLDGIVDLKDAVLLNKAANGTVALNDAQLQNADCNADTEVSAQDAVSLMRFLVHNISTLPDTSAE